MIFWQVFENGGEKRIMNKDHEQILKQQRDAHITQLRENTKNTDSCPWCAVLRGGYPYLRLIGIDGFINAQQVDSELTMCPRYCPFCGVELEDGFDTESVRTLPGFQRVWPHDRNN